MNIIRRSILAAANENRFLGDLQTALTSANKASALTSLTEKIEAEKAEEFRKAIDSMVEEIQNQILGAIENVEPKAAEAIKRLSEQLIGYLVDCYENGVEPTMAMTAFEHISEETIKEMVMDPGFDIVDYINHPDKYLKNIRENEELKADEQAAQEISDNGMDAVEEQANEIVENLKAALDPVAPIIKEVLPDGKIELDFSKAMMTENPTPTGAQKTLRPTEAPAVKENKTSKKDKKNAKNSAASSEEAKKEETAHEHKCTDPNCGCHGEDINWTPNIGAYFDTSSLFMVKNKEMKKTIGERISRTFDNFDTLQELSQYLGDAPANPFDFKLTSVVDKNTFVLTTDRIINGRYTKLNFNFFEGGAQIVVA